MAGIYSSYVPPAAYPRAPAPLPAEQRPIDRNKAIQDAITAGMADQQKRVAAAPRIGTQEWTDMQSRSGGQAATPPPISLSPTGAGGMSTMDPDSRRLMEISIQRQAKSDLLAEQDRTRNIQYESDDRQATRDATEYNRGMERQNTANRNSLTSQLIGGLSTPVSAGHTYQPPSPISMPAPFQPQSSGSSSGHDSVAPVGSIDMTGAEGAAFARAKDQVGQSASASLRGLRANLGGRGMLGGGREGTATASVINAGQGQLADVSRGQAIDAAGRAQSVATTNQSSALAQRSQNISREQANATRADGVAQANLGAQVAQRGQDMSYVQNQNQIAAQQAQSAAAQRTQALSGLISALSSGFSRY